MNLSKKSLEKLRELINEETEYRSGPKLVKLFNSLGFNDQYGQGFPSRWMYTDQKLEVINNTARLDKQKVVDSLQKWQHGSMGARNKFRLRPSRAFSIFGWYWSSCSITLGILASRK